MRLSGGRRPGQDSVVGGEAQAGYLLPGRGVPANTPGRGLGWGTGRGGRQAGTLQALVSMLAFILLTHPASCPTRKRCDIGCEAGGEVARIS